MSNSGSYLSGTGAAAIEKITGNAGGAVGPSSGNINLVGSGSISVTGTPGTSTLTITNSGIIPASFPCDAGTATPALGSLTMAGGTNLNTVGAGSTVTVNLDSALTAIASMDMAAAGRIGTGLVAGNTSLLQAYNVGTASYVTFATLTAHAVTPTMDLSDSVTKAGQYIYRAGGTDVPVADGGTGLSGVPGVSQLLVGNGAGYDLRTATAGNGIAITYAPGLVTASITNGTNGQLLIGGGAGATWASPTSTGGTVTITPGANTLNLETSGSVLTRFNTDAGIAIPALGIVNIQGGAGVTVTGAGNTVTVTAALNWSEQTISFNASGENGYICNGGALVVATLPGTCAVGKIIQFIGLGVGLYTIAQNAGQQIHYDNQDTTLGVAGSIASIGRYGSIELICVVANTEWIVKSSVGNFMVV